MVGESPCKEDGSSLTNGWWSLVGIWGRLFGETTADDGWRRGQDGVKYTHWDKSSTYGNGRIEA